jgi:hypothetical protein
MTYLELRAPYVLARCRAGYMIAALETLKHFIQLCVL